MNILLLFLFLSLQSALVFLYFYFPIKDINWLYIFLLHFLSTILFTVLCYHYLPIQYKSYESKFLTLLLLFVLNLFLPFVGALGCALAIIYPLYVPKSKKNITWDICEKIDLPDTPGEFSLYQYSSGSLHSILLHHSDVSQRQQVIQAALHLPAKAAIPILQIATSDISDDVRLLAFSALEKIETEINKNIINTEHRFSQKNNYEDALIIAEQFWELCYLGIASNAANQLYLKKAQQYLLKAEKLRPTASARLLLGRVLIAQGQPREATKVLLMCVSMGMHIRQVAPYLAEAAFEAGKYEQMLKYLQDIPHNSSDKFTQIKDYWL